MSRRGRPPANDASFHLLSFAREGVTLQVYVDGVLSASGSTAGTTTISNAADLIAGKSACSGADGTTFFSGQLDDLQIYDRALSACEIQAGIESGLDMDADGAIQPLTDMLLLLRDFFIEGYLDPFFP
jgi:hypothetical protein